MSLNGSGIGTTATTKTLKSTPRALPKAPTKFFGVAGFEKRMAPFEIWQEHLACLRSALKESDFDAPLRYSPFIIHGLSLQ
jgi:hypothetical protein